MPQANPPMFTNVLKIGDLENVGSGMGIKKGGASGPKNNPVMAGDWHFQSRTNGLRLHYGTFHALEDMTFSFELPPGLSLTMVFDGSLQFALSSHVYEMGKKFKPAECCGFAIDRPEVITRQLQKNDFVKKVNVFAEKDWLLACCQSRTEIKQLERVFHQHAQPKIWRPSSTILQTAGNIAQYG
ncbi:MAG: hypothetical protein KDJ38_07465, partial [Gammaproteobacteria bacterium]|nr:hypothetical protein [Gammaproteobacteria bacterium]